MTDSGTYPNPRGHLVKALDILMSDSRWNSLAGEIIALGSLVDHVDEIMEQEDNDAESRAISDFHDRAYGNEADDYYQK